MKDSSVRLLLSLLAFVLAFISVALTQTEAEAKGLWDDELQAIVAGAHCRCYVLKNCSDLPTNIGQSNCTYVSSESSYQCSNTDAEQQGLCGPANPPDDSYTACQNAVQLCSNERHYFDNANCTEDSNDTFKTLACNRLFKTSGTKCK